MIVHKIICVYIQFNEDEFQLRTLDDHKKKLQSLEDNGHASSVQSGINSRSALMDLKYFDLCSGALVPDIMHDVLEGALQHELKLLLKYLIKQKSYFEVLN